MALVAAICTQCGANIEVDATREAGICKYCGTAFITEKAINNYNTINNYNIANANITISGIDIAGKLSAAEKLANNGLLTEARQMLGQITQECPEDYRAWFLASKYAYQYDEIWLDDNTHFRKAKALADEDGLKKINTYYDEMYAQIVDSSKDVVDFCANVDLSKLYYCYVKWYYSEALDEPIPTAGSALGWYGYWGFEPVDGHPTLVSYRKNDKYGYLREEIANDCKVVAKLYKKKVIGVITSKNRCVWLPHHVRNELSMDLSNGNDISAIGKCRIYITNFNRGQVVYNNNSSEMVYGNIFYDKSVNFEDTNIGKTGCYIATAVYGSYDCPQVWTLRRFRDNTLANAWYGRAFIRTYYAISPALVKWFGRTTWFKNMWRGKLDKMVETLQKQGVESTPYQDKKW